MIAPRAFWSDVIDFDLLKILPDAREHLRDVDQRLVLRFVSHVRRSVPMTENELAVALGCAVVWLGEVNNALRGLVEEQDV